MSDIFGNRRKTSDAPSTYTGSDIERYEAGQVWLMSNGTFVFIVDVDAPTKMNHSEDTRSIYGKLGYQYNKKNLFSSESNVLLKDDALKFSFIIECKSSVKMSMTDMRKMEAKYIGKVNPVKLKALHDMIADS